MLLLYYTSNYYNVIPYLQKLLANIVENKDAEHYFTGQYEEVKVIVVPNEFHGPKLHGRYAAARWRKFSNQSLKVF